MSLFVPSKQVSKCGEVRIRQQTALQRCSFFVQEEMLHMLSSLYARPVKYASRRKTSRKNLEHVPEALLDSPRSSHRRTLSLSRLLQLLQLGLAELDVLILHPLELLVLAREPEAQDRGADAGYHHKSNDDAKGDAVVRLLGLPVCIRCPDRSGISETVDEGEGRGTLSRGPGIRLSVSFLEVQFFALQPYLGIVFEIQA